MGAGMRSREKLRKIAQENTQEVTDKKCPKCGSDMVLRSGSYGSFYACSKYPECKTTLACIKETGVNCPKCGKRIIVKQGKNRRTFYSCEDYPNCDFSCWDIPQKESCPECGAAVLKKKTKEVFYCSLNCGWKVSHE